MYVYALALGAILTFIGAWDGTFLSYCGSATGIAFFFAMMCVVLAVAFVYRELAFMLLRVRGKLVYNTVGTSKQLGFWSSWFILAAWVAVFPNRCAIDRRLVTVYVV